MNTHISTRLSSTGRSEGFATTYKCSCVPLASVHPFFWLSSKKEAKKKAGSAVGPSCLELLTCSFWEKMKVPALRGAVAMPHMLPLRCGSAALFIDGAGRKHSIFASLKDECDIHIYPFIVSTGQIIQRTNNVFFLEFERQEVTHLRAITSSDRLYSAPTTHWLFPAWNYIYIFQYFQFNIIWHWLLMCIHACSLLSLLFLTQWPLNVKKDQGSAT